MYKTKMTSKGQVTIPKAVREKMGLQPGDTLELKETEYGYTIRKIVDPNVLRKYVGCLDCSATSSDELIKDLRGDR